MSFMKVSNLKKVYTSRIGTKGTEALSNVNFAVEKGEFISVMGESGSGKTSLLNILSTLDTPSEGEVYLEGEPLSKIKEKEISKFRREQLGFVFQDFNLLDNFTLKDNILLPLVLAKMSVEEMERRILPITEKLGIEPLLNHYPYEVSGGQKQRCACARALINQPKIILADEPTGALDSKSARMLLETMALMNQELNSTILMVTHDAFSASFCKRVMFLKDGKIFSEIYKGEKSRKEFFHEILDVLTLLGGDVDLVK